MFHIDGKPVARSTYETYLRKHAARHSDARLQAFVDYQLKIYHAEVQGVDTLPAFRLQLLASRNRLMKAFQVDEAQEEAELRRLYERGLQRLESNDWIRMAHISRYLSQHADRRTEMAAQELMDSLYIRLKAGEDFARLAARYSDDEESRMEGGLLPWMAVNKNLQEWVERLARLEKDEISQPFYSPLGIHIVKWVDRKPSLSFEERKADLQEFRERKGLVRLRTLTAAQEAEITRRTKGLRDDMLAAHMTRKHGTDETVYQENDLEAYFKAHKSDYRWDLPHYRGAVLHCKDKKTASTLKKYLKKHPFEQWEEAFRQAVAKDSIPRARMEAGIFQIGRNAYIDKLVFKCGAYEADKSLPYIIVIGKKLKKGPETYHDVRDEVVRDYQASHQDAWIKTLRQVYKVEIDQEVLKTVNYDGSN